jgi:hypothetical protein
VTRGRRTTAAMAVATRGWRKAMAMAVRKACKHRRRRGFVRAADGGGARMAVVRLRGRQTVVVHGCGADGAGGERRRTAARTGGTRRRGGGGDGESEGVAKTEDKRSAASGQESNMTCGPCRFSYRRLIRRLGFECRLIASV